MNLFNSLFKKTPFFISGAKLDPRSKSEKENDFFLKEIVASVAPVLWVEKKKEEWRTFPVLNQKKTTACVAFSMKKILGILYWVEHGTFLGFSATHVFKRRFNRPYQGMVGLDSFNIAKKGVTLEELCPSNKNTDAQIDKTFIEPYKEKVGEVFSIGGHMGLSNGDFETLASVIQTTEKGVMVWFYFTREEWSPSTPVKKVSLSGAGDKRSSRHSVVAVDYFLWKGKKVILIEDSAHFGGRSRRLITEDFFKERNFFVRYPMNFVFDKEQSSKPKASFLKSLEFIPLDENGNIKDENKNEKQKVDVMILQNILKFEGLFPLNVNSTGYYGSITKKAVYKFQRKHKVAALSELDSLKGRVVGPKTLDKLNELY